MQNEESRLSHQKISVYVGSVTTEADDIVAVGGNLEPDTVLKAYRNGVFPWPAEDLPLLWFCPRERAILQFDRIHLSRSLLKARERSPFRCTIDRAFSRVIRECAEIPRKDQDGTWITPNMIRGYEKLHALGVAHSVETWRGDQLIGGTYGVDSGGAFSAESMFHREPYASQFALLYLVEHLKRRGLKWLDIQMLTPHLVRMGAHTLPRPSFLKLLEEAIESKRKLFPGDHSGNE